MILKVFLILSLLTLTLQIQRIDCQIQGCQSCPTPDICDVCEQNYQLSSIDGQSSMVCIKATQLQHSLTYRILQTCSLANCQSCPTNNQCDQCQLAYFKNSTGQCQFCKAPCETCTSQTYCTACYGGYTLGQNGVCINSTTSCTITYCTTCANDTVCATCNTGYVIGPIGNCVNSSTTTSCTIPYCSTCANDTVCSVCSTGYTVGPIGNCVNISANCTIPNCNTCANDTVCAACKIGYIVGSNGLCQNQTNSTFQTNCSVPNCINCTETGICLVCAMTNNIRYLPSPSGNECVICDLSLPNMMGCLSCSSRSSCGLCANGLQLAYNMNMGICIRCFIPNCLECQFNGTISICSKCALGYNPVLLGEACSQCSFPCATCNSQRAPNNCQTCALPFFFAKPSPDGVCIKNYIRGCIQPNHNNVTLCGNCDSGFVLSPDGLYCNFTCAEDCLTCNSSTSCTSCPLGFYLTSSMNCSKCLIGGCESCTANGTNCTRCIRGFYSIGPDCAPCPSFCLDCTSNTSCSTLSEQSQVLMNIGGQPVLASCDSTCIKCTETDKSFCLVCVDGFFIEMGKCRQCAGNCKTCDSSNSTQCLSCYTNNFLSSSNICVACNPNCMTCVDGNNPNNCTSCWDGFFLSNSSICVKGCPKNCFTCSNLTVCTQCLSGYTTFRRNSSVMCAPCVTNCRVCAEGRPSVCLDCGSGFYLRGRTCRRCSAKCQQCTANGCTTCVSGYYLTSDQKCAKRCQFPCATCSVTSPQSCLTCMAGYSFNGSSCLPATSCNGTCNICPDGFTLRNGRCTACNTEKCQSCNSVNLTECYSCQRGFYLNSSGTCETCPAQCQECLSSTGCLTCAVGYTIKENAVQTASGFECVKCNSPCATCINNPDYCTSCVAGFDFSGWKCAQIFKFSFNLTLTVNMTVFEEKYMSFILALASAARISDINGITLNSITAGSVILEGNVAPEAASGTAEAGTQLEGLKTALQSGEIEGMPVGSSSIVVEDGIAGATEQGSKSTLAIILGICIPIGLLVIIGVVVYFVYGKKTPTNVSRFDTEGDANKGYNFNNTNQQIIVMK